MLLVSFLFASLVVCIVSVIYLRYRRTASISYIRGPRSQSIFTGNYPELRLPDCGVTEREWQEKYGHVVRIKAAFGENRLWISDPKALQHILQSAGYDYKKTSGQRVISSLFGDYGIGWADGDVHKRHRKVMLPAFGMSESKSFMLDFRNKIESVVDKWKDEIWSSSSGKSQVFNIPSWLARGTLDAIGTAAFDYEFGAVSNSDNPVTKAYNNIFTDAFSLPSPLKMFWENVSRDIPSTLLYLMYEILPGDGLRRLRDSRSQVRQVAKKLYEKKRELRDETNSGRDVMSLLIKANLSENERTRLQDDEIIPQMSNIMLAGHETTSNTVSWMLYELAQHPEIQTRLRAEIMDIRSKAQNRGDSDITISDFENMPYTIAVMKETMRFHPIAITLEREAAKDDILPLYTPLITRSGEVVKEIMIPKGTVVLASIHGYHLNKDVWGRDADLFNPERWFSPKNKDIPSVGVYGNLLVFSAGVRSCIGWRFAVVEMQTFLISLLANFEFSIPEGVKIRMDRSGLMVPMLEGEIELGSQLPLNVTIVSGV